MKTVKEWQQHCIHKYGYGVNPDFVKAIQDDAQPNQTTDRVVRLTAILDELFIHANSYAGDETGVVAGELHEACNRIGHALQMLEDGITKEDSDKQIDEWLDKQHWQGRTGFVESVNEEKVVDFPIKFG